MDGEDSKIATLVVGYFNHFAASRRIRLKSNTRLFGAPLRLPLITSSRSFQPMDNPTPPRPRKLCHRCNKPLRQTSDDNSWATRGINGNRKLKMETQNIFMNPEQIREAAPDLYHACKFVLDPNRSGYALFSHRATIILEAAVAKAEGRSHLQTQR